MNKSVKNRRNLRRKLSPEIYRGFKIKCMECKRLFGINADYYGVVTCPYCGEFVEQP